MDALINALFLGFDNVLAALLSIFAAFALTLAGATIFFVLLYADMLIAIGLCLGPIMLAMSVLERFRKLTDSWLSFLLGAVFTKVICGIVVFSMMPIIDGLKEVGGHFTGAPNGAFSNSMAMIAILLIASILYMIVKESPNIASSLFGGVGGSHGGMGMMMMGGKAVGGISGGVQGASAANKATPSAASFRQKMSNTFRGGQAGAKAGEHGGGQSGKAGASTVSKPPPPP